MSHLSRTRIAGALIATALVAGISRSAASAEPQAKAADIRRLEGELARLQQQISEQRQLIFQLMQMHDTLLKYLQTSGGATAGGLPSSASMPSSAASSPAAAGAGAPASRSAASAAPSNPGAGTGSITGHVRANGGAPAEAYVYLEGPRAVPSHPPTVEIKQQDRRFVPAVSVVPVGARVVFPNQDTVFHNVFSSTPGDAFDLGPLKAGQTSQPVALLKPGHVEIFCNIHSKMRADVLVVPNVHWIRVRPDGSFQLPGIPVGTRRIVLWGPTIKPISQQVDVTSAGATATFSTEDRPAGPHPNKNGGAYGSYEN
jgi:plastocyanin